MLFLERGPLAGDSFDQISEAGGFVAIADEREYVDLNGHGGFERKSILRVGSEDPPGTRVRPLQVAR
jgi:hypothetical protein